MRRWLAGAVASLALLGCSETDRMWIKAELGGLDSQVALARLYSLGEGGLERDEAAALRWYTAAAEQGLAIAQFNLAIALARGDGVPRDYVEAYMWFCLSSRQGLEDAREWQNGLDEILTADEIATARERANAWRVKRPVRRTTL